MLQTVCSAVPMNFVHLEVRKQITAYYAAKIYAMQYVAECASMGQRLPQNFSKGVGGSFCSENAGFFSISSNTKLSTMVSATHLVTISLTSTIRLTISNLCYDSNSLYD